MRSLTVAQIREADRRCIEELGIPGVVLMNNAGRAVFEEIQRWPLAGRARAGMNPRALGIICGKGNNGGDGFVVARLALLAGYEPEVILLAKPEEIQGDAAVFLRAYHNLGGTVRSVVNEAEGAEAVRRLAGCALVVDALLGTGIQGEVRGIYRAAIESWPRVETVAVDVPSGLNADTGEPCGCCVRAHTTVTFQFKKRGFDNPSAREYIGRLVVADIGIPEVCADDGAWAKVCAAMVRD